MKIAGLIFAALFLGLCLSGEGKVMAVEPGVNKPADGPGLRVGTVAPDFTGVTYIGNKIRFSDVYKNGPVVLIFYRGAWCPYCNLHLQSFQKRLKDFEKLGTTILAVSIDKPEYGAKTVKDNNLGFEVISDTQAQILEAYKLVYKVPDQLAEKYRNEYQIDLEAHSGRTDHLIAIPATYIIDKTGKVVFAYANEDYKVRTQPEEVLEVLGRPELYEISNHLHE